MKVRITKWSSPGFWYAGKIGYVFKVDISGGDFVVSGTLYMRILKSDCEIVESTTQTLPSSAVKLDGKYIVLSMEDFDRLIKNQKATT